MSRTFVDKPLDGHSINIQEIYALPRITQKRNSGSPKTAPDFYEKFFCEEIHVIDINTKTSWSLENVTARCKRGTV